MVGSGSRLCPLIQANGVKPSAWTVFLMRVDRGQISYSEDQSMVSELGLFLWGITFADTHVLHMGHC